METQKENGKILSLQALRGLAFLGIFFIHTKAPVYWASMGVSTFFTLSGFLMYYRYEKREIPCTFKDNIRFSWSKIKKLYPLHIITMWLTVFMYLVIWNHNGFTMKDVAFMLTAIGLNITLLQSWVPYNPMCVSLNGVAWFLSVTMFLYFMFPYLKRWMKNKTNKHLVIVCLVVLCGEILACVPLVHTLGMYHPVYLWFSYNFPVFRLSDFFAGCCLGKYWLEMEKKEDVSFLKASMCEIMILIITTGVYLWSGQEPQGFISMAANNGTVPYVPLAVIWILLFIHKRGILTRILINRFTIFLGNISPYIFLIHFVVVQYFTTIKGLFVIKLSYGEHLFFIGVQLVISILLSVAYQKMVERRR